MLEKAKEHLDSAEFLLTHGHYRDSVSRAYYAVFSTMWAYLGPPPKGKWGHSGIRRTFVRQLYADGQSVDRCRELRKGLYLINQSRREADYTTASIGQQTAQDAFSLAQEVFRIVEGEKKR